MHDLKKDLLDPRAYPGSFPPGKIDLIQTHISWVFLTDRDVYKVKRPVSLGFLDYSSPGLRENACRSEVELNSRLAPQAYLGVVPIKLDEKGHHRVGYEAAGETVDWAVHMRRYSDEDRADRLLARGVLDLRKIDALAKKLADFHAGSRCDSETSRFGEPEMIEINLKENFDQTRQTLSSFLSASDARELEKRQLSFLRENRILFGKRVHSNQVRDGHGDLRLEQIYFGENGEITILDCIEFNDRFRFGDVASDIAFLSMDLRLQGRADLAEHLIAIYARESNDFDLYSLIDFYESYRAFVRGKVATFVLSDPDSGDEERKNAKNLARRYFKLALERLDPSPERALLIAVGGLPASGKSTIADWLGGLTGAPVIDTDRTRKFLAGVAPTQSLGQTAWKGAYSPDFSRRVYDELLRRAQIVLESGRSVILDATFASAASRKRVRDLALFLEAGFRLIECQAADEICRQRLAEREKTENISDARAAIFREFKERYEPVRELSPREHLVIDTSSPLDRTKAVIESGLAA